MRRRSKMAEGKDEAAKAKADADEPEVEEAAPAADEPAPIAAGIAAIPEVTEETVVLDPNAPDAPYTSDEPVHEYKATIVDPPEEVEVEAAAKEDALPELPEGHEFVVYRGTHDLFEHGEHKFRIGQPVAVPSEFVEELLTYPGEAFERLAPGT